MMGMEFPLLMRANCDDLAKIVAAWPTLPEPIRRARLVRMGYRRRRR